MKEDNILNTRERFLKIMSFQKADRLPLIEVESYESETLKRWHKEGLPENKSVADVLGMDRIEYVPIDFNPLPGFESKLIHEDENYITSTNHIGITVRYRKDHGMIYSYLDHPIKNRDDWMRMKERFDPNDPKRYPANWGTDLINHYNQADHPIGFTLHPFFFRLAFFMMGMERFMLAFYDQPDLVHDMFEDCADFCLATIQKLFDAVRIDFVAIAEDLAFKHSSHISPDMYREFWFPHQKKVIDFLKSKDVPVIGLWSSGDIRPVLPLAIECGYNATWPLEEVTGINAVELYKEYGKSLGLIGNIGIQTLIKGKEHIKQAVETKVLPLIETGGYIPTVDDMTPPEVSFENYAYYIELLKQIG
jgi:uroporphyrinogen-III decarboxylase